MSTTPILRVLPDDHVCTDHCDHQLASVADLVAVGESLGGWVTMWHAEDWDEPRRVLILPLDEQ